MIFERILFNVLAFILFAFVFLKMVKKNNFNYITLIVIQAIGIAMSFFELLAGKLEWTSLKLLAYIMSIILPLVILYLDKKNINLTEIVYTNIAKVLLLFNNNQSARKLLIKLTSIHPNSYIGHKMLAQIYENEGGMRKAVDEYVKAIDINKKDFESYYKIAELLNNLTRKQEAITLLENVLKFQPDLVKASSLLGELLLEEEKYKEAANVYINALKYDPGNYDLYYNLGISYTHLNDFKNAKNSYERAAQINHLKAKSSYNLGKISLIYNDIEHAEKYFTEAIYGEEVEAMSYYELAKISMMKKDKEKAVLFLEKAIELDDIYANKSERDLIFMPIRAYIRKNTAKQGTNTGGKKLNKIEQKANEHLNKTTMVVERLNDKERLNYKPSINYNKEIIYKEKEDFERES